MTIIRIIETTRGDAITSGTWVIAQMNTGVVCACLPTLWPLIPKDETIRRGIQSLTSLITRVTTSRSTLGETTKQLKRTSKHPRYQAFDTDLADAAYLTKTSRGSDATEPQDIPMDGIVVKHDVSVI